MHSKRESRRTDRDRKKSVLKQAEKDVEASFLDDWTIEQDITETTLAFLWCLWGTD